MIFLIRGKLMPYTRTVRGQYRVDENAARYKNQEAALKMLFQAAMRDAGEDMLPGQTPLEVVITIHKSPLHKCDLDNLVKALLDAGNRVIYPDDRWIDYIRAGRKLDEQDHYAIFEIRRVDQPVKPCETMEVLL
jgi:Holliday junction resolvase RusA-like endonuclease